MFSLLYFTHDTMVTEKPVQTRKEAVQLLGAGECRQVPSWRENRAHTFVEAFAK